MDVIRDVRLTGPGPTIALNQAGSGPLVLLLHGIGGNRTNWDHQLCALSPHYLSVAWDMRGYGQSDDFSGPMLVDDLCSDLVKVMDYYGESKAHIIGLSMGGMIAQEFYRRYPERAISLLLANTNTGIGVNFSRKQKDEFVSLRKQPLLEGNEPSDLVLPMQGILLGEEAPQSAIDNISASIAALHKQSYIKAVEAIVEFDSSDVLSTITVPVLLIGSTHDRVIPIETVQLMSEKIQNSQFYKFERVGHLSNLERPHEFSELMLDFLAQA